MFGHKKVKSVKRTKPQPKRTPAPKKTATRHKVAPKKKIAAKPQKRVVARKIAAPRKIPAAKKKPSKAAKTEMTLVGKRSGQSVSVTKKMPKGWRVDNGATTNPRGTKWVTNGESFFNGKRKSKLLITDEKLFKENINKPNSRYELKLTKTKKPPVRAGEVASINYPGANGHKGCIGKRKKNGQIIAHTLTHATYTDHIKNIELAVNPQPNDPDKRPSHVVKKPFVVTDNEIGKRHPDVRVKNPTDKSIMRKLRTTAKKTKS